MFKYLIFQTVLQNSFSYSAIIAGIYPVKSMDSWFAWGSTVNCYRPRLFISVSDAGIMTVRPPLIRMSRGASNFFDSGSDHKRFGCSMIFVPPSPGLFLLLLMFRNCEQPPAPRSRAATQVAETEEEQPPSGRFWIRRPGDRDDWNAILSYLTTLASLLSVLSPCRPAGEVCNILSQSTFSRQINVSTLGFPYLASMKSLKTWLNILLMTKKVWL